MEILRASIVWLLQGGFQPVRAASPGRPSTALPALCGRATPRACAPRSKPFAPVSRRRPPIPGTALIPLTFVLIAGIALPTEAHAQVDEYQVKAAFLFNFAKFVQWPDQAFKTPAAPIVICILGKNPFGSTLDETVKGKTAGGRTLKVLSVSDTQTAYSCQILFVASSERKRFRSIVGGLKGAGVLSVGEADQFTGDGGVINFNVERGSINLEINVAAAEYTGVHISAKLLSLSHVVRRAP